MKIVVLSVLTFLLHYSVTAQSPVSWSYSAKKIADKTYEVHMTATISAPWNIYSVYTPAGGPLPTSFTFVKNPLLIYAGEIKEVGTMKQKFEEVFDVNVKYYSGKVDFVQVVKLKSPAKTLIKGAVEFMACNQEQCLPPKTLAFSVALD